MGRGEGIHYLDSSTPPARLDNLRREIQRLGAEAPYGWGHTLDLGAGLRIEGVLEENYRGVLERWRALGWLPARLDGKRVADIGGWNGGMTIELVRLGASVVNVEEIPPHARQFSFVAEVLQLPRATLVTDTLYRMPWFPETRDLDLIVLSGVLYHLSDMIVALKTLYDCLTAPGTLLIHTQAAPEREFPYADFGRFAQGVWWQPSTGCVREMLAMVGFDEIDAEPYLQREAILRATKVVPRQMTFKRGLNYPFANILDAQPRSTTPYHAPAVGGALPTRTPPLITSAARSGGSHSRLGRGLRAITGKLIPGRRLRP